MFRQWLALLRGASLGTADLNCVSIRGFVRLRQRGCCLARLLKDPCFEVAEENVNNSLKCCCVGP